MPALNDTRQINGATWNYVADPETGLLAWSPVEDAATSGPDVLTAVEQAAIDAAALVVQTALDTQEAKQDAHETSRERPHLPDGGTTGQRPTVQADGTIAYETPAGAPLSTDPDWANDPTLASDRATTTAEMDRRDALQVNVADRVGVIRDAGEADNTKWADELAIRTLVDSIATGQRLTPFAATFAALPALPADTSATKGYLTILTADDVGTGTAQSPEFPAGIYVSQTAQADGWAFGAALGVDILAGVITDFDDPAQKSVAKTWKGETLDERFLGKPKPLPADGSTLDVHSWYQGRVGSYTIPNGTVEGDFLIIDNPSNLKGEATRPLFTGKFANSTDGEIVTGTYSVSPNGRWRLYWDATLDGGNGAWRIHSNRSLIIPITYPQDNDLLLTRNNDYAMYNSATASDVFKVRVPKVPSGRIRIRYDNLSTGPIRIEMEDGSVPDNLSYNGGVSNGYDFGVEFKSKEISLEANTTTGFWIIYIDDVDEPIEPLAADNKPIAHKLRRVTADTTIDLADVPATEGILYGVSLGVATLSGNGFNDITNEGPNFEPIWFESTGTAGEVRRLGNDEVPAKAIANWEPDTDYAAGSRAIMYAPIGVPSPYTEGKPYLVETTDDRTAVAALDLAQWNLWSVIGEHLVSGGSKRIITDASAFAYAVSVFELNDLQSNDWLAVGAGAANAYTWFNVDVNNFNLVDKTGGLVTHGVTGPNRTLTFSGDVRFVHTTAGNQENVVVYPLASSPTPSRSFAGHFTFNGTTQYFIPSVSGTYDVYEEIVTYTNWELITTIRQLFATSKVTRWTNNSNRLKSVAPNINTSNTGTVDLIAGEVYEIDPSAGGGTNQGSHLVTLTLRS